MRYQGRIKEQDTYIPALNLLNNAPNGFMKTSDLIKGLENHFAPVGEDAEILAGRSDTKFSQIVRNIISHRNVPSNLIGSGLAEYDNRNRGLRITENGRRFLET